MGERKNAAGGAQRPSHVARILFVLAGLAALAWAATIPLTGLLVNEEVRVPLVVGLDSAAAERAILMAGLTPRVFLEQSLSAPPNQVLSQSPEPEASVRPGRLVAIGVNSPARSVRVPDFVGFREREALLRAGEAGVSVQQIVYIHADRPVGVVVHQEPPTGSELAAGESVTLSVSRGQVDVLFALPDLRGMLLEEAEALLATLGVRQVERVAAAVSMQDSGRVIDQRPAPGLEIVSGTPVTLVFPVEGTAIVRVPELRGVPLWQAQLTLQEANLELGSIRRVEDPNLPAGVIDLRPSDYTLAGSFISVVYNATGDSLEGISDTLWPSTVVRQSESVLQPEVATTPEEAARQPLVPAPGTSRIVEDGSRIIPFRFNPASVGIGSIMREPYLLKVLLNDAEGERVVFEQQLAAGENVEIPVRIVGDGLLQTYINGLFFQAWSP